jgi:ribosomal protein L3 glutamine methyltransferase
VLRGFGLPFDADLERTVEPSRIENIVKKRITQRVPAAYLLNQAWLDGVPFYVDRRVIIPRSHIAFIFKQLKIQPRRILDLCTGSGCLAILAARAFPRAGVHASDISADALAVAARNVRKHKLEKRIRLVRSDLFTGLGKERYDLIVSNPPYVSTPSMRRLPPEYRHEPGIALAGGRQGLDYVARIIRAAPEHLNPGGLLVCEVGDNKPALERAYPRTSFLWPLPQVFILAASRTPAASRKRPTQGRARR